MPGLYHSIKRDNNKIERFNIKDLLRSHPDIDFKSIIDRKQNELFVFSNQNYPSTILSYKGFDVVLLGMIYNFSISKIKDEIEQIIDRFINLSDYKRLIRDFVRNCDGDFIVYAFSEEKNKGLLFNDFLGRLPLYYHSDKNNLVLCSEQKGVLHNISKIDINKNEVISVLMFGQTLGDNTLFNNIKRLLAGKILSFGENLQIFEEDSESVSFKKPQLSKSKKQTIKHIASLISESLENRADTLLAYGYRQIADLSGGFDSRIVLGSLAKKSKDVDYFTFEYIQDESTIATNLFKELNSPGTYTKLSFTSKLNEDSLREIIYKTDGLVNYISSNVCYNDLNYLYNYVPKLKTARFGGLGGEFFRHPYKIFYKDILYGVNNGFYNKQYHLVSQFINHDSEDCHENLKKYFQDFKIDQKLQNVKKLYVNEYYRIGVGLNAEDRERIHFWGIHPLWSKDLVNLFANEFPLKWANYNFFTQLMKEVDSRLLNIPIYNKNLNLKNKIDRIKYDLKEDYKIQYKRELLHYLKGNTSGIYNFLRKFKKKIIPQEKERVVQHPPQNQLLDKLRFTKHIFNEQAINSSSQENIMLSTLLIYLSELENKYPEKFN